MIHLSQLFYDMSKLSLPFKGRVGVGMGKVQVHPPHPPTVLRLEGGGTYWQLL